MHATSTAPPIVPLEVQKTLIAYPPDQRSELVPRTVDLVEAN